MTTFETILSFEKRKKLRKSGKYEGCGIGGWNIFFC